MGRFYGVSGAVQDDDELIRRFRRGDAGAFRDLYRRHRGGAYFYALALARDEERALEAVQEAFLAILRGGLGRHEARRGAGSFRAYLLAAVRSRVIDAARRQAVRREVAGSDRLELFESPNGAADAAVRREVASRVSAALLALPPPQREVVILRIYDGMTLREIGALTGVSENTAASRYRYACKKLREALEGMRDHG